MQPRIVTTGMLLFLLSAGAEAIDEYAYVDLAAKFPVATDPEFTEAEPDIYGDKVVYYGTVNTWVVSDIPLEQEPPILPGDVYVFDIATGQRIQLTDDPDHYQGSPTIHGDLAVWHDERDGVHSHIYAYDLSQGLEFPISTYPSWKWEPDVGDRYVVWYDYRNDPPNHCDIYAYDLLLDQEFALATGTRWYWDAHVDGPNVVFQDAENPVGVQDWAIGYADASTGQSYQLINDPTDNESQPAIFGDLVVWAENCEINPGHRGIRGQHLQGDTTPFWISTSGVSPEVHGRFVIYLDDRYGQWDVIGYDLWTKTEFRVTDEPNHAYEPAIHGNTVVWMTWVESPPEMDWNIWGNVIKLRGDWDSDGDVDLTDYAQFPGCMTGPGGGPVGGGCEPFDFEVDDDVDLEDFARFQIAFTGEGPGP